MKKGIKILGATVLVLGGGVGLLFNVNPSILLDKSAVEQVEQQTTVSTITENEGEGGGNPHTENENIKVVSILVSGDEFLYENEPIQLDEILEKVKAIENDFYVEIKDNNATHNAYSKLVETLEALEIRIEKSEIEELETEESETKESEMDVSK